MANRPFRDSLMEIDDTSWLLGDSFLLSHVPLGQGSWRDSNGGGYVISDAPKPLPETRPISTTSDIRLIHEAGDASAVYLVANAFLKIKRLDLPDATREHVTLAWMHQRKWSFSIPDVYYHGEDDSRYYIVLSRMAGDTIDNLWSGLGESARQHYAEKVADICAEMAIPANGSNICGVDGNALSELYICGREKDCSPQNLRKHCLEMGMDCSTLVFYHCDLGPTNILVDPEDNSFISIIDWETAGFVPVQWIRTKFRVSSGMDLSGGDGVDWRKRVMLRLGEMGYTDVAENFMDHLRRSSK